ncbi:MAG: acyl-CoA dehydrogenase family protein [Candidatus Tectimicrobiota bacterium]
MFTLSEEHEAVRANIRHFAQHELRWRARHLDSAAPGSVDMALLHKSCDFGLLSGGLPEHYGGALDRLSIALALEELARWEAGIATLFGTNTLALAAVALAGNKALMDTVFPEVIAGEARHEPVWWSLAVTERRTGSDLVHPTGVPSSRMMMTARRRGEAYLLSGRKAYCAGGNLAHWLCVFATVSEDRSPAGLTAFVVPTTAQGFHVSEVLTTMGLRACPLVEFYLDNVLVPAEHRLTAEGGAAGLLETLNAWGRCQGAAIALGIASGAWQLARQHALIRVQGGSPIVHHQMVQHMLADMMTQIEAARLLTYRAATAEPAEVVLSSMAKVFASDVAVKVATDTIQIMGAYGTTAKSGAEKYYRDAKMTQIFEGTNEICRLAITAPLLPYAGLGSIGSD